MNLKEETKVTTDPPFELIKTVIKIFSTCLISVAILWELGNLYATLNNWQISSQLNWIFWLDRIILISHGIEAIIAGYYARLQHRNPFQFSLYIFFVGTVGLLELKIGQTRKE
ncbi:MAG: hypothetical protein QNJ33_06390 [Crocosphaera sp.]|nr:hypothetical protein [Crocosphaera sp.]